jgi:hypothetical protein
MAKPLTELLETVQVAEPQEAGGLQVFGLRWDNPNGLVYTTLDEALAAGTLEVTEVSEGGSVPVLKVVNRADVMVFLMTGEQLIGAKQNRVLNADIMAPAQRELPIPVSCVEAGRWRYHSPKFAGSGTMAHGQLRKMMSKGAHAAYRAVGSPSPDQGQVWGEVARKLGALNSASPSHALYQAYEDHQARLNEVLGNVRVPEGCSGVAVAHGGKVAGVDLFDKPATLAKLWPKLLRGYALDALEQPAAGGTLSADAVRQWLRAGTRAKAEPFKSPGLGYDVRLESAELVGAGLVVEERPVHVELFVNDTTAGA